jgi:peptidoglycan/LPS O-acetylase OafA/YrhL
MQLTPIGLPYPAEGKTGINIEIECLRAVAILLVILLHAHALFANSSHTVSFIFQFVGTWTGVDLFFCISGFVISRSFQAFFDFHRREGQWWAATRAFWVRRIFRLTPTLWVWLFIGVFCSWAFNSSNWSGTFAGNLQSVPYVLLNVANFAYATGHLSGNGVYWSLALEDQFYLVFPFFLFFIPSSWRWKALLFLIIFQIIPERSFERHPLLWCTRIDALMWGCIIYQFSLSNTYWKFEPKFLHNKLIALVANGILVVILTIIPVLRRFHQPTFLELRVESIAALASGALVFLASFERGYVLPLERAKAVLAWIGSRSYGIYLIHIPLYDVIRETWLYSSQMAGVNLPDAIYNAYCAVMILVLLPILAELNFRFVETPLRRTGKQLAQRIMASHPTTELVTHVGYEQAAGEEAARAR